MTQRTISLALAFSAILHEWLTPEQMTEVLRLNKTPEYPIGGSCATHNFCDPNQAMIDAEVAVLGEFKELDDEHILTINDVWEYARKNDFFAAIYQPNYAPATGDTVMEQNTFHVTSSNGDLWADPVTGEVQVVELESGGEGIDKIKRFNVEEWQKTYNADISKQEAIDILDLGYWMEDGTYEEPTIDWRAEHRSPDSYRLTDEM